MPASLFEQAVSNYEQGASAWEAAGPQAADRNASPEQVPDEASVEHVPENAWDTVKFLATKAAKSCEIESEIRDVFAARATISKRMADAYRRKDDDMASKSAKAWIQSEVRLHALFSRYSTHVSERNALVESLSNAPHSPIVT